jgi:predicted transcriptional regulator
MKPFTISNVKILSFFEQRPKMDVETTLLKFVDIMETLQESMNTKFERSQEVSQFNLSKYMIENSL